MIEGKMGHHQESVQALRRVATLSPDSPDARLNLGIALADQYDLQGALQEFSEAIRLDPNSALAYYNKGRVLYDLNRRPEALPFAETACKLKPNYPDALYLLALVLGSSPRARQVVEQFVVADPDNPDAHSLLAKALLRAGDEAGAIRHWKIAVKLDPQNSSSLYNLTRLLAKVNDPEARAYMDRFQELQRTRQLSDRVQRLNNFALEAANAHNWPQAVQELQESIAACGECKQLPILHRNLGLIYAREGEIKEAESELEAALKISPNDTDARTALEILRNLPKKSNSPAQ
jgi:tetratricopeptide (TPR) repeat protein